MKNYFINILIISGLFSGFYSNARENIDNTLIATHMIAADNVDISGSTTANSGDEKNYTVYAYGAPISSGTWSTSGGVILEQTETSVRVRWASVGIQVLSYYGNSSSSSYPGPLEGAINVTVNIKAPIVPSIISQDCTRATLGKSGAPPEGVEWHWQGSNSNGETKTFESELDTYEVTSSGNYYLRARSINGVWSSPSFVQVFFEKTWFDDTDLDGKGDPSISLIQCLQPDGYVSNNDDQCPATFGGGSDNGCTSLGVALNNENFIYTITPQKETSNLSELALNRDAIKSVTYFDGLGRVKQSIGIRQTSKEKDIVTHVEYDAQGRQPKEYLPYASDLNNGGLKTNTLVDANTYYSDEYSSDINTTSPNPFSEKDFEASPLNRVMKQAAPGNDWAKGSGHEIEYEYRTNDSTDAVKRFDVTLAFANDTYTPSLVTKPNYLDGELYKNVIKDENHIATDGKLHTTEEFTNKKGRVILKRTYALVNNTQEEHDTYYVYDDFGNLTFVLPPKMEGDIANMDELGYQYVYDYRNRLIEKKIPGKGKEYIVYNKLDQPILTQDANQKEKDSTSDEWLFTKYDAFGRVAYTGIATSADGKPRAEIQAEVDSITQNLWVNQNESATNFGGADVYYDNGAYPTNTTVEAKVEEILTINYYDSYVDRPSGVAQTVTLLDTPDNESNSINVKGLATVSRVKVLNQAPAKWIHTITYYDKKGRPVYTYSINEFLDTKDVVETSLDFVGKPLKVKTTHTRGENTIVTTDNYTYDHVGRLITQTQCIGDCGISNYLPPEYNQRFYDAFYERAPLTLMVTGDSTFDNPFSNSISYVTGQAAKIKATVYNNAQSGQSAARWALNVDGDSGTIANAIANTSGGGETTIMLFNFGINEDKSSKEVYKSKINGALDAYLAAKANTKIVMIIPIDAAILSRAWSREVAIERGLPFVDVNSIMDDVRPGFPNDYYEDHTHPTSDGTRRYWNAILHKLVPSDLASNITFDEAGLVNLTIAEINAGIGIGETSQDMSVLELSGLINSEQVHHNAIWVTEADIEDGAYLYIDPANRPENEFELIVFNKYDNLGQLKYKKVGGTPDFTDFDNSDELQKVDYSYNIRGWLTDINDITDTSPDKLFNFGIAYNDGQNPLYNGNIAETQCRTANTDNTLKQYSYEYDPLNRIIAATGGATNTNYDVSNISYDKMGNIQSLTRNGWHLDSQGEVAYSNMDVLDYKYEGVGEMSNKLARVSDTGQKAYGFKDGTNTNDDFEYDDNGNMTSDANKGITDIDYNHFNLPTKVTVNGTNTGTLDYIYSANGIKLRKIKNQGGVTTTTDYIGNYVYEGNTLKQISQPEGYIEPDGDGWQYVYYIKDHLNNIRITFADDNGNGNIETGSSYSEIRREQNYYPFGLEHKGYNNITYGVKNNLKTFQDQEFTEDLGFNVHEWKYRMSDPAIGRFLQVDPLAEEYNWQSVYSFASNQPIHANELEGLENEDDKSGMARFGTQPSNGIPGIGMSFAMLPDSPEKRQAASTMLDFIPLVGDVKGFGEGIIGTDATGNRLSADARKLSIIGLSELRHADDVVDATKKLLPSELDTGTYKELIDAGKKGDNVTPHHMPPNDYMNSKGVSKNDGVSMNMEQPTPGKGGRHRQTESYGKKSDKSVTPRSALAKSLRDARKIYMQQGLYGTQVRDALQNVVKRNKKDFPELFIKKKQ